jgi:hypothetical protein
MKNSKDPNIDEEEEGKGDEEEEEGKRDGSDIDDWEEMYLKFQVCERQ